MEKPKVALYWCSSCGGCEESILDIAENILKLRELIEIVFWPVALDIKYSDLEGMKDSEISVCLINGAVRMDEQEHMVNLLRKKSQVIIAYGSCAHIGGVCGLANLYTKDECLLRAYKEAPSVRNPEGILPQCISRDGEIPLELSEFHDVVKPLNQIIKVEHYIPGCPPHPRHFLEVIMAGLLSRLIPEGSIVADQRALCATCSLRDSKPEKTVIKEIRRLTEWKWNPHMCFLAQGMICLGPATRGGCEERCIKANMPCRGCYGPTENVFDQGGKFLSAFASMINSTDEGKLENIANSLLDMVGLFYRYSLPSSLLEKKIKEPFTKIEDYKNFVSQRKTDSEEKLSEFISKLG